MGDALIIHESVLYDALGESVPSDLLLSSAQFLNECGTRNYRGENIAYLPGEVFSRVLNFCNRKTCDELVAFCELLVIKYSQSEDKGTYLPYVKLACNLCLKNTVSIICSPSQVDKFREQLQSEQYMFSVWDPKFALSSFFAE